MKNICSKKKGKNNSLLIYVSVKYKFVSFPGIGQNILTFNANV